MFETNGGPWPVVKTSFVTHIELFYLKFQGCHCSRVVKASNSKLKGRGFESPFPPSTYSQTEPSSTLQFRRSYMVVGALVDWDTYSDLSIQYHVQEATQSRVPPRVYEPGKAWRQVN